MAQRPGLPAPPPWQLVRLGDISRVLYGKARPNDDGAIPVVGSGGIFGGTSEPLVRYETLVIGRKGAAGSVFHCPEPCYPSDTTFYLEWLQDVHVPFIYYEMQRRGLAPDRSVIPSLARADVENYQFMLPPLAEQRAIARVLRAVREAIAARRRELALERERKAALMAHLFTHGTRGEPTKQTRFGDVPASWHIEPLETCAYVQTGIAKGRKLDENRVVSRPYLRVANVQDGYLDLSEIKEIELLETEVARYSLQPGDVLLTEGGDFDKLGRGFIWHGQVPDCVHQNHIFAVRADGRRLLSGFLAYLIQSPYGKAYFLNVAHRTTNLASINSTKLKAFPALIPPLDEQQAIVDLLDACDVQIDAIERESALHEELFRALLEELMSGRLSALPLVEEDRGDAVGTSGGRPAAAQGEPA